MECPDCSSAYIVKNGKREIRHGKIQTYYCNSCGTNFTDRPMRGTSYPARVIVEALKLYSQGSTLRETYDLLPGLKPGVSPQEATPMP